MAWDAVKRWLGVPRKDYFPEFALYLANLDDLHLRLNFQGKEQQILRLFYNERLKVDRSKVPLFWIYASLCDTKDPRSWALIMTQVNGAILKLKDIDYIQPARINPSNLTAINDYVGPAAQCYELTASGLKVLLEWHPPVLLRLRAWIAVLPTWLVATSTIAGGIAALWKIMDWSPKVFHFIQGLLAHNWGM
jgi:hypothetical protein